MAGFSVCTHLEGIVERLRAVGAREESSWLPHRNGYDYAVFVGSAAELRAHVGEPLFLAGGTAGCVAGEGAHIGCRCSDGAWRVVVLLAP